MGTNAMKALRFAEFGPPSVLRIEEVAIPEPGEGEALVHVKAAAINPSDYKNVLGYFSLGARWDKQRHRLRIGRRRM
jgi:NADPH:quinone reductase-like Zn-dependent oxidoreductase